MASSNRHWPSMFKSKPHPHPHHHHQWQQQTDMNPSLISSNGCHQRSPFSSSSGAGCEERSPEPKPRWNPRPEQIRILEAIFNSGMVNPPRDEIRKIRAQLQEYGQVGDANVFYWFQNRKSRSKHKQRHLQNKLQSPGSQTTHDPTPPLPAVTSIAVPNSITTPSSSSSSSSDKSTTNYSPNSTDKILSLGAGGAASSSKISMLLDSPTASVNQQQPFLHTDFLSMSPFFFPVQQAAGVGTQGFMSYTNQPPPEPNVVVSSVDDGVDNNNSVVVESCSGLLLSDLLLLNHGSSRRTVEDHDEKMKLQQLLSYTSTTAPTTITSIPTLQGVGESGGVGPTKSTVFINDVAFEVTMMAPFNVREAFGEDAVLIHSSGQPVLTNEWGITLQPLHHGSFYYLIRTLPSSTSSHHHHHA